MMREFLIACGLILCLSCSADSVQADLADFDDIPTQTVPLGGVFASGDFSFDVIGYGGGTQLFISQSFNFGTGNYLNMAFEIGVQVNMSNLADGGSFEYNNGFPFAVLEINGQSATVANLVQLNGATLGGVDLTVAGTTVTMDGIINSLAFGGTEFGVDDLQLNVVPEPGSVGLLAIVCFGWMQRRRRHQ